MLYGGGFVSANPIILRDRKIISIDGGCVLKDDGQLNCLIIPNGFSQDFSWVYYDKFPVKTAVSGQRASETSAYFRFGDNVVKVLERGEEFSRCRHVRTGYEMDILTKYLSEQDGVTRCNDCSDYELEVQPGDSLSIVEETSRGYYVKKSGVSGWYRGEII
jgi:protein phosphatase